MRYVYHKSRRFTLGWHVLGSDTQNYTWKLNREINDEREKMIYHGTSLKVRSQMSQLLPFTSSGQLIILQVDVCLYAYLLLQKNILFYCQISCFQPDIFQFKTFPSLSMQQLVTARLFLHAEQYLWPSWGALFLYVLGYQVVGIKMIFRHLFF